MIIHPDGRLEGTPEELAAYQAARQSLPVVPDLMRTWTGTPWWGIYPPDTSSPRVWSGSATYDGTAVEVRN